MKMCVRHVASAALLVSSLCHCAAVEQSCPTGQELVGDSCEGIECTGGQLLVGSACVCPNNQELVGGACATPNDPCADLNCGDGNDCTLNLCDSDTGTCSNPAEADGTGCDFDGLAGVCSMGACADPALCAEVDCGDGDDCTKDLCDRVTGECSNPVEVDGTSCQFGELPGVCMAGTCEGLCSNKTCSDENDCTQDTCNELTGQCANPNEPDNEQCDFNGLPGFCSAGECQDAMLCAMKECGDDNECTDDECNPANGQCVNMPVSNGSACNYAPTPFSSGVCFDGTCGCDPEMGGCTDFDTCSTEECNMVTRACVVTDLRTSGSCTNLGLSGTCTASGTCRVSIPNPF